MHAVQIDRHGGSDVLTVREIAEPALAAGEVLIRTTASSLNPVDWKTRDRQVGPPLPATLGWDSDLGAGQRLDSGGVPARCYGRAIR
ncbi:alcohol dehydrogenase catalytic domain-containing protein [Streptomyces sp. NPDC007983]|uniref:alcohol dehydrogenase catalytic domain-containing protein n=1 Tax=Streptomyces sp. NPDC007983 TaxID=3364800 RepID=UPI0036EBC474